MSDEPRPSSGERLHFQQFGLKDSAYERPNQDWVCGSLGGGNPCIIGPDAKGRCLATAECRPFKKGDRWVCTRRDGGGVACACEQGPLPDGRCARPIARCAPVRSIRARRGRVAFAAFAMSVGLLCFCLLGPSRSAFVAPGELSDAHAQVLKASHAHDCAACHVAGKGDANQWLRLAIAPVHGAAQNQKCLVCHLPTLGHDAGRPHSLSAATLANLSAAARPGHPATFEQKLASFAPAQVSTPRGEIACATCHHEHGGRHNNLKAMSDTSCQVCHKSEFQSFSHGHPEFDAVHRDRAGITFDHASHEPRMPGGKLACAQCHRPDPAGRTMQFTSFEQACVGCHDQGQVDHHGNQLRGDLRVVFQLSAMDPGKAGAWPAKALTPGTAMTPMLEFLVAGDDNPDALKALKSLDADVVAKGSTDEWDADPEIKAKLAAAIKRVVKELSPGDDTSQKKANVKLRDRLARAAGVAPESAPVTRLIDQLTAAGDQFKSWQQHSFPQLPDDLAGAIAPATAPATEASAPDLKWIPPRNASGWFVDSDTVSVNHRTSHADDFDKNCIDLLASGAGNIKPSPIAEAMSDDAFLAALRARLLVQFGGSCVKCHGVQPSHDASFLVNWKAVSRPNKVDGYANFDHHPHLVLFPGDDNCVKCHRLVSTAPDPLRQPPSSLFSLSGDPNHGMGGHEIAGCIVCHNPHGAPDTCLTCHIYHMTR